MNRQRSESFAFGLKAVHGAFPEFFVYPEVGHLGKGVSPQKTDIFDLPFLFPPCIECE
jgi:hypothetical protein